MRKAVILVAFVTIFLQVFSQTELTDSVAGTENNKSLIKEQAAFVVFDGDTLFTIYNNLGHFTPEERASSIVNKLDKISNLAKIERDSFVLYDDRSQVMVMYKNLPVLSVTNSDAETEGTTRYNLAVSHTEILKEVFDEVVSDRNIFYWLIRVGYALLMLAGLVLILFLVNKLFSWVDKKLVSYEKGLKRKRKTVFRYLAPRGPDYFFSFVSRAVKIISFIVILIVYLPLPFSFLPWTEGLVHRFYIYISVPLMKIGLGLWSFISEKLIFIILIFLVARYLLRIFTFVSSEIEAEKLKIKGFHREWAKPTLNIVKIIVYAFTLVFVFPYLPGSDSKAFQGVSIFLGVLFSLGSTSAIANIVAGIVITYMRPFQIGDRVKIGPTVGDILEKNLLVTRLKTLKNEDVTIPNSTIINTHLLNYTKHASKFGIILHPTVTIGYDVPADTVIKLLLDAAKNTKNLTRDFKPFVLQKSLSDFYVEYELNVYTKQPGKMVHFYSELNKSILNEFNKAGVEILSPHYSAFRDGNASTIPEEKNDNPSTDPVGDVIKKATGQK